MAAYVAQWKKIKADYETATNRKKPSDTFMGIVTGKTNLGSGFAAMDAALKKEDLAAAKKAHTALEKSATAYRKVLVKAATAEKNKDIQKQTNILMDELEELIEATQQSIIETAKIPNLSNLRAFSILLKTPAFDRVEAYAKKTLRTECLEFLQAMLKKDYPIKTFDSFIRTNEVNLISSITSKFDENDLKNAPWAEATQAVITMFNDNLIKPLNSASPS